MGNDNNKPSRRKPLAEIVVGVLSAILVLALVIFLSFQAMTADESSPDLIVMAESTQRQGEKTLLNVKILNRGERAASAVTVLAELPKSPDREISFDYVAAGSTQRGAFLFNRQDVVADDIRLTVHGFIEP